LPNRFFGSAVTHIFPLFDLNVDRFMAFTMRFFAA